jgi:hypothetical protein
MRWRGSGIAGALVLSALFAALLAPPAVARKTIYTCDTTTSWRATIDRSGNFPE